ncbi:helix-turn-helix domain-containing protein [Xylophilus sp.]|uniref:helix-turn-helix domain-containing protein n=1 Tax=Xylophilus sp. TaxID=2653893 RepID=UPI0013BD8FDC|nr:helix-turn-helix domain-containing protein [Xylophilus sp.]KAF1045207.1 MAG: Regulatory protein LuxO [Xylophilus sp.]
MPAGTAVPPPAALQPPRDAVDAFRRRMLADTLQRHGGSPAAAARALGLDRANVGRLARRLGVLPAPARTH